MRDPKRIHKFCKMLEAYWSLVPDWRFGQLIVNVFGSCKKDPFFYEDDEIEELFKKMFEADE